MITSANRRRLVCLLAVLVMGIAAAGCRVQPQPETPAVQPEAQAEKPAGADPTPRPQPGAPAPEVVARDVHSGEVVKLSALQGQIVLLNFWATWCGPCRLEMPDLEKLQQETTGKVRILAVGGDPNEAPEALKAFADEMQLTFTVAHDGGAGMKAYKTIGLPTTFVIDRKGIVRERQVGMMTLDQMRNLVQRTEQAESQP